MTYSTFLRRVSVAIACCLFGAGCAVTSSPPAGGPAPSAKLGFGKLPSLLAAAPSGASEAIRSSAPLTATADANSATVSAPAVMGRSGGGSVGVGVPSRPTMIRPIPYPVPRPVAVEYSIDADLPSWGAGGDALLVKTALPDSATVAQLASRAGLPSQAFGNADTITSVNLQWLDADKIQWTFDAGNRSVSFWKQESVPNVYGADAKIKQPPQVPNEDVLRIADAFLDAHGFGAVRQSGGTVEERPQILPMMKGTVSAGDATAPSYPCPMMESGSANAPATKGVAEPALYPYPCGWWPETATVVYGGTRDGKPVTDAYGNPQQSASVTVNLATKEVSGGNIQLDQNVDRSSYPLIDAASAKKRLQSGGQNPVWPWGSESKAIKVSMTKIEIVWIRYDNWQNGATHTYFIPGLRATGTVDRGIAGTQPEEYRTVIPLVDDSAFDQSATPSPIPLPATGGGGAVEILPAPAPAPVKK